MTVVDGKLSWEYGIAAYVTNAVYIFGESIIVRCGPQALEISIVAHGPFARVYSPPRRYCLGMVAIIDVACSFYSYTTYTVYPCFIE